MRGGFVTGVSQLHAVTGVERDLARDALHEPVHTAGAHGIVVRLVPIGIDLERVVDWHFLLDGVHPIEFRLLAAFRLGWIFIGGLR